MFRVGVVGFRVWAYCLNLGFRGRAYLSKIDGQRYSFGVVLQAEEPCAQHHFDGEVVCDSDFGLTAFN